MCTWIKSEYVLVRYLAHYRQLATEAQNSLASVLFCYIDFLAL